VRNIISHNKQTNARVFCSHHFINTVSLRHVSALKWTSSGSRTDTFQQESQKNYLKTHFPKLNFTSYDSFC